MKKPASAILAIDIGNTSVVIALYQSGRVTRRDIISTKSISIRRLEQCRLLTTKNLEAIYIVSVVPKVLNVLKRYLKSRTQTEVRIIGRDLAVPIENKTHAPDQVGIDRLVCAYEAYRLFNRSCIVIDFGTAITFDVVSKRGEYLGGLITPGIDLILNALYEHAALLPKVRLRHPKELVGKNTVESIRSGASFGLGGLCDGIVTRLVNINKYPVSIVSTGGYAKYMSQYCSYASRIVPNLILNGIYQIHINHQKKLDN